MNSNVNENNLSKDMNQSDSKLDIEHKRKI